MVTFIAFGLFGQKQNKNEWFAVMISSWLLMGMLASHDQTLAERWKKSKGKKKRWQKWKEEEKKGLVAEAPKSETIKTFER